MIEKDGSITNIETLGKANQEFKDEAIAVIKKMPKWTPGILRNKPARVQIALPVRFNE